MPQEIHVVKCRDCSIYLTDIVKKSGVWVCKICGVKQSGGEVFRGTGAECRVRTQQLNMARGDRRNQEADDILNAPESFMAAPLEADLRTRIGMVAEVATENELCMGTKQSWGAMLAAEGGRDLLQQLNVEQAQNRLLVANPEPSTKKPSKWAKYAAKTDQMYETSDHTAFQFEMQRDELPSSGIALKRPLEPSSATTQEKASKWTKFTPQHPNP